MTELACGTGHGVAEAVDAILTPEHWTSLVTSLPTLILHRMAAIHDMHVQSGAITQAFIDGVLSQNKSLYEVECKKFEDQNQLRIQSIRQALIDITSLSAHDFAKHAACFGTMLALDSLGIHAFNLAASSVGRAAVSKIATVFESPKASHTMAEVAGVGRVAVEEGSHIANMATGTPHIPLKSKSIPQKIKQAVANTKQKVILTINQLKNTFDFNPHALEHILEGNLNKKGHAGGFHYNGMPNSKGKIIPGTKSVPNHFGVYEAEVTVNGIRKTANGGKSTFFPDHWNAQEVVDAINEAFNKKQFVQGRRNSYVGELSNGMQIEMFIDNITGKVISAFPKY